MAELNITPLLDLAFVLLIIFIITTPLLEQGVQLNLPTGSATKTEVNPKSVKTISVNHDGEIFLDKQRVNVAELTAALTAWKQSDPEAAAVLRFDRDLRMQQAMDVIDAMQKAGISRMALMNTPEQQGQAPQHSR
jgi:biopolymer transport protein ExbD